MMRLRNTDILCRFLIPNHVYSRVGAGVVGAGAASRYGSGSAQMMRLRLRNTVLMSM
jgi:hypothetical protein